MRMRLSWGEVDLLFKALLAYRKLQMRQLSKRAAIKRSKKTLISSPELSEELKNLSKLMKKLKKAELKGP